MSQAQWVFSAVLITSFFGPFLGSSINLAIPYMAKEFNVLPSFLTWYVSAYLLGSIAVLVPMGKLADIMGRKKIYTYGLYLFIVMTIGAGLADSLRMLITFSFLQGIASAMIFSTGMTLLVAVHKITERGKVIGYSAAATYIGLSLGPFLGGIITHFWGWRSIFFLIAIGLGLSLIAIKKVHDEWYGQKEPFDIKGSLLYFFASTSLLYGCSSYAENYYGKYLMALGLILFVVFVLIQRKITNPVLNIKLFSNNIIFAMSNLAAMINYSATFAISFVLSLYLQLIQNLDAPTAGMIILIQPLLMALFSPLAGSLSDKIQPRIVATVGMALNTIGLVLLLFISETSSVFYIAGALVIIGLGFALFSSPNNNAIMSAVEQKDHGVAASVLSAMRLFGQGFSMALVNLFLSFFINLEPDYHKALLLGFKNIFVVFSGLSFVGIFISLARGKNKDK